MDERLAETGILADLVKTNAKTHNTDIKAASGEALVFIHAISALSRDKKAYERLAADAVSLILLFRRAEEKADDPEKWLTPGLRKITSEFVSTVQDIRLFVERQLQKNALMRAIDGKSDAGTIAEYRQRLQSAMQAFQVQSHIKANEALATIIATQERLKKEEEEARKQAEEKCLRAEEIERDMQLDGKGTDDEKEYSETGFERFRAKEKARRAASKKKKKYAYDEDDDTEAPVSSSTRDGEDDEDNDTRASTSTHNRPMKPRPRPKPSKKAKADDDSLYDDFNRMNMAYGGYLHPHPGHEYPPPPGPPYYPYSSGYSSYSYSPPYAPYPPSYPSMHASATSGGGPVIMNVGSGNYSNNSVSNINNTYSRRSPARPKKRT